MAGHLQIDATDFATFVRGRHVAVVGPSRSIIGSGLGRDIDGHDLVVRLNHGWPVAPPHRIDPGGRFDALYHCCNGDHSVERVFAGSLAGLRWACFEQTVDGPPLLSACKRAGIDALDVTPVSAALRSLLGTPPNTGLVAVHHLPRAAGAPWLRQAAAPCDRSARSTRSRGSRNISATQAVESSLPSPTTISSNESWLLDNTLATHARTLAAELSAVMITDACTMG